MRASDGGALGRANTRAHKAEAKVAALEARVKELEEALRPFAEAADRFPDWVADTCRLAYDLNREKIDLTIGHCRAARKALEGGE